MQDINRYLIEDSEITLTSQRPQAPVAYCWLERSRTIWMWRFYCPYCSHIHAHGGGPLNEDPRQRLGHRVADLCRDGRGRVLQEHPLLGYILVEDGGLR